MLLFLSSAARARVKPALHDANELDRTWGWSLWSARVPVPKDASGEFVLTCKATDSQCVGLDRAHSVVTDLAVVVLLVRSQLQLTTRSCGCYLELARRAQQQLGARGWRGGVAGENNARASALLTVVRARAFCVSCTLQHRVNVKLAQAAK